MIRERLTPGRRAASTLAAALLLTSCGGSDDGDTDATSGSTGSATTVAEGSSATSAAEGGADGSAATDSTADTSSAVTTEADAPAESSGGGSDGEAIRLGIQLEPGTMDLTSDPSAGIPQVLLYNVYETLVRLAPDGSIEPLLADSYEISEDGLTYTFRLHEGIKFQQGQDLTAEDVVYSIDNVQTKEPAHPFQATFAPIESATAVDDYTVELKLSQPSANLLFYLTQGQGSILDSEGAGDLAAGANGTGPFSFGEWVVGDHITLNRNDAYWGDAAKAASVEYRYIPDPNALSNAMLAGDLEIVPNFSAPELLPEFEKDDNYTVETGETYGEIVLSLNGDNAPLDDARVRQAITYAIDSQAVVDLTYGGYGTTIGTFSTPLDPYFKDNNDVYAYDPEKAKALLAEAGVADVKLRFIVPPTSYATRGAEVIQSQLKEVGIDVEVTNLDSFSSWIEQVITNQDFDMSIVAHVEPKDLAQYGNPDYYWGNDSPEVAPMLEAADAEPDEAKRNEMYGQVLDSITADAADTWLYVLPQLSIVRSGVDGYQPSALSLSMASVSYSG